MKGLIRSFYNAFAGIGRTIITQRNMKIHLSFAVFALVVSFLLRLEPLEWVVICILIALVLLLECLNTAIEAVIDRQSTEPHPLSRNAKDAAAAAVLIAAILSVVVGLIIYINAMLRIVG